MKLFAFATNNTQLLVMCVVKQMGNVHILLEIVAIIVMIVCIIFIILEKHQRIQKCSTIAPKC